MNRTLEHESFPSFEDIDKRVIEPFDVNDVGVDYAISRWREDVEKARVRNASFEIAHRFTSPALLEAVIDYFRADIKQNYAIFQAKLAANERRIKLMNLRVVLGTAEAVFVDEDEGEHVVPALLAVIQVTKSTETKMLRQLVQASLIVAGNDGNGEAEQPEWPTGLGDGIEDFARDLTEFLCSNGDQGRELVTRICEDTGFARKIRDDEKTPGPIRFLAQVVAKVNGNNTIDKERRIGFAVGNP